MAFLACKSLSYVDDFHDDREIDRDIGEALRGEIMLRARALEFLKGRGFAPAAQPLRLLSPPETAASGGAAVFARWERDF